MISLASNGDSKSVMGGTAAAGVVAAEREAADAIVVADKLRVVGAKFLFSMPRPGVDALRRDLGFSNRTSSSNSSQPMSGTFVLTNVR